MTNQELHEIEERACLMPMTILGINAMKNIPDFLLIEFFANSGFKNYTVYRPVVGAELERRASEANIS